MPQKIDKLPPEDSGRYIVQDNVLTIRYLNPERDPAMYQCQAKNILATKYSSAQLRVLSLSPDFKKRPLEPETYAGEGGNVTIVCSPEAAPRPKFTWKKDNNIIGSGGRRKILEIGNLIISPVSRDDEGLYTCQAQNKYGSDTSHGRLIVLKGPSLTSELPPKMVTSVGKDVYMNCRAVSEEILDYAFIWSHNGIKLNPTEDTHHKRLKFPNNFPKAFPEAPVAGKDVRLECVAFGYPVPSYNWTRRGTPLPRSAKSSSFNRVLTISNVQVEDQGEYLCRATNGRAAIENSVSLSIQAEPNFTIPLTDKHMDNGADLTWTCEAFGIPDVTYHWYRNGIPIEVNVYLFDLGKN
uniref:Ig-like domain-containing protein n=1 Tax=Rhodnius prolixus TaxID=13249 RepID=T1I7N2_RHOPR